MGGAAALKPAHRPKQQKLTRTQREERALTVTPQGGLKTAKPDWAAFIFLWRHWAQFQCKTKKKNGGDAEITVNTR